jgi:hypothetical protein
MSETLNELVEEKVISVEQADMIHNEFYRQYDLKLAEMREYMIETTQAFMEQEVMKLFQPVYDHVRAWSERKM